MPAAPITLGERFRAARRATLGRGHDLFLRIFKPGKVRKRDQSWADRVAEVLASPDNNAIPRHPDAGKIIDGTQVMHNGLRIVAGCYYGNFSRRMFAQARGVHEPQEERVFAEVLPHIPAGGVMLELGAYWGFYSLWFASRVKDARCILVEPVNDNLDSGRANFRLNNLSAEFVVAGIADKPGHVRKVGPVTSVDALVERFNLQHIHILHSDIQGFEGDMLKGAAKALAAGMIDYIFISTHGQELHESCRRTLQDAGFEMIADADMNETYSFDGLLVGKRRGVSGPGPVPISHRTATKPAISV
jgi:predicted O-methyltransferase YrrM